MTDKELLELAAKAAGIERLDFGKGEIKTYCPDGYTTVWNPLNDDGDALRLAILMKFDIEHTENAVHVGDWSSESVASAIPRDRATRRAIVRAAAEIGKAMP